MNMRTHTHTSYSFVPPSTKSLSHSSILSTTSSPPTHFTYSNIFLSTLVLPLLLLLPLYPHLTPFSLLLLLHPHLTPFSLLLPLRISLPLNFFFFPSTKTLLFLLPWLIDVHHASIECIKFKFPYTENLHMNIRFLMRYYDYESVHTVSGCYFDAYQFVMIHESQFCVVSTQGKINQISKEAKKLTRKYVHV